MASTRLTNDMRNAFIAKVMEDVPQVDYEQKIRDAVNKAALANVVSDFVKAGWPKGKRAAA